MAKAEAARVRIVFAGDGAADEHEAFARAERIREFPYVLSTQLGMTWQIAKLPYAVLLDARGVVRSHGIVNSREHLESLVEADERGVASIQQFARQEGLLPAEEGSPPSTAHDARASRHAKVA